MNRNERNSQTLIRFCIFVDRLKIIIACKVPAGNACTQHGHQGNHRRNWYCRKNLLV